MSMQYLYEVPSPSFHMVPRSPFINKPSVIASSPVAIVPDVEARGNTVIDSACYIGTDKYFSEYFSMLNSFQTNNGL